MLSDVPHGLYEAGGGHPDSRAVAARAHLSAPGKGRRRDPLMTSGPCCQRAADCKWPLLNVTEGAICIQLPGWQRRGRTHSRTASGQMCPKPACVSHGISVYVPMHMPSTHGHDAGFTRLNMIPNLQYAGSREHSICVAPQ